MATSVTGKATEFIQFTRVSNATVTDIDGKVKWAPHNLLTNSESFDNAAWSKGNLNTTGTPAWVNVVAAPNGTLTADRIIEDTTNSSHGITQGSTVAANVAITVGAFVKANGRNIVITAYTASHGLRAIFNLSTLAITNGSYGSSTYTGAEIVDVGNGWYRVSVSGIASSTEANPTIGINTANGTTLFYTGDGSSGFYIWGAHVYRSDLGGMQANTSAYPMYNPTTPKNLLANTENFNSWTKTNATVTSDVIMAPSGLQVADKVVATTATGYHAIAQGLTLTAARYVLSFYAKAAEYTLVRVADGAASRYYLSYDLASGSVVAGSTGGSKYISSSITSVGDGWYRCSVTFENIAAGSSPGIIGYTTGATIDAYGAQYTGDGTSGIYLWGAQLSDSASLDSYVPVYGAAVTSAAYYGPRRDFDPVSLACKGLLVEEQRTNLLLYSAAFNNAVWTTYSSALSTVDNSAIGPDGLTSASTVTLSANSRVQIASVTSGATYTLSVWMRTDSGTKNITLDDINDGNTPLTVSVDTTWRRYSLTYTKANTAAYVGITQIAGTSPSTSGTLYVWGWQYELGSFPTSYIPTGAATATRSADIASVSTQAFPYSSSASTIVVNATIGLLSDNRTLINMTLTSDAGGSVERGQIRINSSSGTAQAIIANGGTVTGNATTANAASANSTLKAGYALAANDLAVVLNAGTAATDATVTMPNYDQLRIGTLGSVEYLNGHIRQITYLPRRISNTELQTRTTL